MYYLLAQINFIGQGRDIEGWMDILILVIVAAVYLLGAILKTAKSKKAEQERNQQFQKTQQKASKKSGGGLFEQFVMEVKKAAEEARKGTENIKPSRIEIQKIPPQQAGLQKYPGQAKPVSPTQVKAAPPAKAPPAKPKISRTIPKVESEFEKFAQLDKGIQGLPGISTKIAGLPGKKKKIRLAEPAEAMPFDEVLWDYDNPDELKRAIVHYEILGKPLGLRNPDESIIGLC